MPGRGTAGLIDVCESAARSRALALAILQVDNDKASRVPV